VPERGEIVGQAVRVNRLIAEDETIHRTEFYTHASVRQLPWAGAAQALVPRCCYLAREYRIVNGERAKKHHSGAGRSTDSYIETLASTRFYLPAPIVALTRGERSRGGVKVDQ